MGEIHDLHCNKCGYSIKAMLGIGMLYSPEIVFYGENPSLIELVQNQSITDAALEKISTGAKVNDNYGHALYACPNDDYLFNKFYFKVDEMEPEYPCPYCDATLKRVVFSKSKIAGTTKLKFIDSDKFWSCPKCSNDLLTEFSFENWD